MPKYIDADAAKRAVVDAVDKGLATHSEDLEEIIDDLPAADVEPVVHAKWIRGWDGWADGLLSVPTANSVVDFAPKSLAVPTAGRRWI